MTEALLRLHNRLSEANERGAAMAEYGLLLAFVALAAIAIMTIFGETLNETFGFASTTLEESPALAGE